MPRKNSAAALKIENDKLKAQIASLTELSAGAPPSIEAPSIAGIETRTQHAGSVTVACKIPQGLVLQLQHPMSRRVPTGRGAEDDYAVIEVMVFGGKRYHVFGPAMPAQVGPDYILPHAVEGGYALTRGIPADFWRQWLEQNKLADYVVNKMIFAMDAESSQSKAREHGELKSGLEPLSQETGANGVLKDRRVPKSINTNVSRVAYDAERDAERGSKQNA